MGVQAIAWYYGISTTAVVGWYAVGAFAINMIASAIITKAFFSPSSYGESGQSQNPGNRQQVPPATDNKLPVVYGSVWLGGTITDLSITDDNQNMYFVLSLCEVTNTNAGQTPDTISFGNIYYGGKLVTFKSDGYTVASLTDESTGEVDTTVAGKIEIYLYKNGSQSPVNSTKSAIVVMSASGLSYTWDASKLMSNCAFAIVHLTYNRDANITGLQQTKFNVINSRTNTGDCISDYLVNTRYGCAIPTSQIDSTSLSELTTYSNQTMTYTTYAGFTASITRFKFDGILDTTRTCMQNLQDMASCCDCLLTYNEITAKWGVVVQKPTYTVVMDLNDSNIISSLQVTPLDLASSYNVIECKFPDKSNQDAFNSVTFDLAQIAPTLLYPNEPVNKMSISLPLVNDNVRAQYLANRLLKAGREDLQLQATINYIGIQLQAGDVVTVTNTNYGWTAKPFRVNKVIETFSDNGSLTAKLTLSEFNASVYDDVNVTEFSPADNSGIPDPNFFGTVPAPTITNEYPDNANPLFLVNVTASSTGIIQYAEVWYSAYSAPTSSQLIFAGTTAINADGNPYTPNTSMGTVSLANIPSGNWYFFTRMVNSIATSNYSLASSVFRWRPTTYQFVERYLAVAYATSNTGAGFSLSPTGKTYYGLCNQTGTSAPLTASSYTWYLPEDAFGTTYFLCYSNRSNRKFSFSTGLAGWVGTNAAFVPTNTLIFDPSIWSALPNGTNIIDLDHRTGQLTQLGFTAQGDASGELIVENNPDGAIKVALKQFHNYAGGSYTGSAANITIDNYGRVVGFTAPDDFYFSKQSFTATSGQTAFTVTRSAGYITGQCLVFKNGCLLDTTEYTDSLTTVTLSTGATTGDIISVISFKSVNATTGVYASFTRNTVDLASATSYTASGFTLNSGYEFLFINGVVLNELDYNIVGQEITDFPSVITGKLTIIQWTADNLGQPNGFPTNIALFTVIGQSTYTASYDANAFDLYSNGVLLLQGTDYTTATGSYTLASSPTTTSTVMVQQTFARTGAV